MSQPSEKCILMIWGVSISAPSQPWGGAWCGTQKTPCGRINRWRVRQKDGIDSSLRKGNLPHRDFEMSNLPWPLALEDGGRFCQLPLCCPRAASRGPRGSAATCLDKSAAWRISRGSAHALALGEAQQKEGPEGEGPRQPFGSPPSKGFKPLHLPKVCLHILSVRWEETSRCVSPHPRGFVTAAWGARDGNSEGAEQQRPDEGHTVTEGHVRH